MRLTRRRAPSVRSALVATTMMTAVALNAVAPPANAEDPPPPPPCSAWCAPSVTPTDEGFLAEVEGQMAELNSAESSPVTCTVDVEEGGVTVKKTGYYRWRLPVNSEETWDAVSDGTTTGTWYRYECFVPGYHTEYGDYIRVQEFEAVNPDTVAQVAIDRALARIGEFTLHTSPDDQGLVAIDTWFWAELAGDTVVTEEASVPGMEVVVTARPAGLRVDPGDDGEPVTCDSLGVPWQTGAASDCTHSYVRAGEYTVSSSLLWTGSYTVNGDGPFEVTSPIARSSTRTLPVAEAQAINTRPR